MRFTRRVDKLDGYRKPGDDRAAARRLGTRHRDLKWLAAMMVPALAAVILTTLPARARTVLLDVAMLDQAAAIDSAAPRLGWSMDRDSLGHVQTSVMRLTESRSLLMRFNLAQLPPGQRIVYAELVVPILSHEGNEPRFHLWRLLADWGPGVCHDYRAVEQDKLVEWTRPGGRGIGTDRAARPTEIVRVLEPESRIINVTEDVEMWYDGAAPNHGWAFSVEDLAVNIALASPVWDGAARWTLRITYEPKGE